MATYLAKSNNGRTNWALVDGRLKETSPDTPTFTLTATDTMTLYQLLAQAKGEILEAMLKEQGATRNDAMNIIQA